MTLEEIEAKIEQDEQKKLAELRRAARKMLANHKEFERLEFQQRANLMGRSQCEEYEDLLEEWRHRNEYEEDEDGPIRKEPRSEEEITEELTRCLDVRVVKSIEVLLTTGGPGVRLMMHDIGRGRSDVEYQYQDWHQPWTTAKLRHLEQQALRSQLIIHDLVHELFLLQSICNDLHLA